MIEFVKGDILRSQCEALVNPVNTVGVMGNGLARQFKDKFPTNYKIYREACLGFALAGTMFNPYEDDPWSTTTKRLDVGLLCCVRDMVTFQGFSSPVLIINFPTKKSWKKPSELDYIKNGLIALRDLLLEGNIKSVAIPPLGCGKGLLDWNLVKQLMELILVNVTDVDIKIHLPI